MVFQQKMSILFIQDHLIMRKRKLMDAKVIHNLKEFSITIQLAFAQLTNPFLQTVVDPLLQEQTIKISKPKLMKGLAVNNLLELFLEFQKMEDPFILLFTPEENYMTNVMWIFAMVLLSMGNTRTLQLCSTHISSGVSDPVAIKI